MFRWILSLSIVLSFAACGSGTDDINQTDLAPRMPAERMIHSAGWEELVIIGGGAKTTLDMLGHFVSAPNACYLESFGAVSLSDWNKIANTANEFAAGEPRPEPTCIPNPSEDNRQLYPSVEIKIAGKTKPMLDARGNEICTTMQNTAMAAEFVAAIGRVITTARYEGCPERRGQQ